MINPVNYNSDTNLNNQSNDNILPRNNTSEKSSENDKYMNLVENEIKRYGHNLNDSLFMGSIINILDGLSSPNTFNKTLFIHILDFAKFDKEKPITIRRSIKLVLPYFAIICATWILLVIGWYILGIPIGPGVSPTI